MSSVIKTIEKVGKHFMGKLKAKIIYTQTSKMDLKLTTLQVCEAYRPEQ